MSQVAVFTRYIGVIVILSALLLSSPRWTAYGWLLLTRWVSSAGRSFARAVRPQPQLQTAGTIPVLVRVGSEPLADRLSTLDRHLHDWHEDVALLDGLHDRWGSRIELLDDSFGDLADLELTGHAVEVRAVLLGATGIVMITQPTIMDPLPMPIATAADLALVLATFLVLKAVVEEHLTPQELAPVWEPAPWDDLPEPAPLWVPVDRALQRRRAGRGVAGMLAFSWPGVLGTAVATVRLGHDPRALVFGGAFELMWLAGAATLLIQPRYNEVRRNLLDWLDGSA